MPQIIYLLTILINFLNLKQFAVVVAVGCWVNLREAG